MSTRVTKEAAKKVAKILTEKKFKEVEALKVAYQEFITKLYEYAIPTLVMECFGKHGGYVNYNSSVYIHGSGIQRWEQISLTKKLPKNNASDGLKLSDTNAEKYIKMKRAFTTKKDQTDSLLLEVETAIFNARTYDKVAKLFPEAAPHLPIVYPTPAINYTSIRSKIK